MFWQHHWALNVIQRNESKYESERNAGKLANGGELRNIKTSLINKQINTWITHVSPSSSGNDARWHSVAMKSPSLAVSSRGELLGILGGSLKWVTDAAEVADNIISLKSTPKKAVY